MGKWSSEVIRGHQRSSEVIRGHQYGGVFTVGKKAVTPNSTSRRAQRRSPASSPGSGMQKSAPKPPLSCGAEERCGAAGGRAARVRAQSLAAGT